MIKTLLALQARDLKKMNLSEKLTTIFILLAVGFFGLNTAHSKIAGKKATYTSVAAVQIQSLNWA